MELGALEVNTVLSYRRVLHTYSTYIMYHLSWVWSIECCGESTTSANRTLAVGNLVGTI
jgi:hypothetical protein